MIEIVNYVILLDIQAYIYGLIIAFKRLRYFTHGNTRQKNKTDDQNTK